MPQFIRHAFGAFLFLVSVTAVAQGRLDLLKAYVARPDPNFGRGLVEKTVQGEGFKTYIIDFNSLAWRAPTEVNKPVWHHWLNIVVPDNLKSENAILLINGGHNNQREPEGAWPFLDAAAIHAGAIVVELTTIPSEPLNFFDKPGERVEDDIIAYSWDKFMTTADPEWIAQYPMTKAASSAMTIAQQFVREKLGHDIQGFVVTGASKRGWTTWLTGAVDPRVIGIVPVVIDVLNFVPSMMHHHDTYGFWAEAIRDYVNHKITDRMGTPEMMALANHVDPFSFKEALTMPKMVINAANDEFFLPDSSQFYFGALPGEKYLRYVPNSGHGIDPLPVVQNILLFFEALDRGTALPNIDWTITSETALTLSVPTKPNEVILWEAVNPDLRDFRKSNHAPVYHPTVLPVAADGHYQINVSRPERGWKAWFVETSYEMPADLTFSLTTNITVVGAN